jgi:group I intron endonuclease
MNHSGIYKIQSLINPKRIYIGSAINFTNRRSTHLNHLKNNKHHSQKLQRHYNKYGKDDLKFSLLLGCNKEDLIKTEQYFIYLNNQL